MIERRISSLLNIKRKEFFSSVEGNATSASGLLGESFPVGPIEAVQYREFSCSCTGDVERLSLCGGGVFVWKRLRAGDHRIRPRGVVL